MHLPFVRSKCQSCPVEMRTASSPVHFAQEAANCIPRIPLVPQAVQDFESIRMSVQTDARSKQQSHCISLQPVFPRRVNTLFSGLGISCLVLQICNIGPIVGILDCTSDIFFCTIAPFPEGEAFPVCFRGGPLLQAFQQIPCRTAMALSLICGSSCFVLPNNLP